MPEGQTQRSQAGRGKDSLELPRFWAAAVQPTNHLTDHPSPLDHRGDKFSKVPVCGFFHNSRTDLFVLPSITGPWTASTFSPPWQKPFTAKLSPPTIYKETKLRYGSWPPALEKLPPPTSGCSTTPVAASTTIGVIIEPPPTCTTSSDPTSTQPSNAMAVESPEGNFAPRALSDTDF